MKLFKTCQLLAAAFLTTATAANAATYSPEAVADLRYMIEEEKLAGDVYRAFGVLYPDVMPFRNIPRSEDSHVAALVGQAAIAGVGVDDLTSLPTGKFANPALQALYESLIVRGSASTFSALSVGRDIEILDIADLTDARAGIPADSSLYAVYGNLMNASNNHLRAFNTHLAMYPPAVPEPETYGLMLAGLALVGAAGRRRARR